MLNIEDDIDYMARGTRIIGPGLYHHVFNRGNDRHPIFKKQQDYRKYIRFLEMYNEKYKIQIIAYALMEWHMHLFLYDQNEALSQFIHRVHGHYAYLYNIKQQRVGHVFGDRFKNKIIDTNTYGKWLSRYIHRQAVDAGIVDRVEEYEWTSYHHYIGISKKSFLHSSIILGQFGTTMQEQIIAYRNFVENEDEGPIDWKQTEINTNPIIGSKTFVKKVSEQIGLVNSYSCEFSEILEKICRENGYSPENIKNPSGQKERAVRRHAIKILSRNCGISATVIAKELNITRALVSIILKH